ncbi:aspartyl/asparaginyl beta-hydroxylase domain-containing protein [Sphingomonas sp. GM_Shp_2]|uniref:aspartyl/asparaginyl beta-hydroxylase domain-containing protein n=1 Tax=Sphingomonas sp. GM_Shp_2 TaxID=2937380 RepID=UPI002269F58A|nr:aspartyl/asparaginyl beta-hydroxylase domain-containing protein [Sphingomonas sp. GM_Shp_2]
MKYFKKIATGLDVQPALAEIAAKGSHLWSMATGQSLENAIRGYRGNANPEGTRIVHWEDFAIYPAVNALFKEAVSQLPKSNMIERARVRILPPQSKMKAHRDSLKPNARRYQVCLQAGPEAFFQIKNEKCRFNPGELWFCNILDRLHFVDNPSDIARAVLVIDAFV